MTADDKPDWLTRFTEMVLAEDDYAARHPGHVFLVMLHRDEAEGLLAELTVCDKALARAHDFATTGARIAAKHKQAALAAQFEGIANLTRR